MNLQEAIDKKIKSSYLEEMQEAKEQHFHDFPKYLHVTKSIIEKYESPYMQHIAGMLINEDIEKGIIRIEGDEILCNCESCRNKNNDYEEDFKELKKLNDSQREKNSYVGAILVAELICDFCEKYNKDETEIIIELNKDLLK